MEKARREGLGEERLEVTPEQEERLRSLIESQEVSARQRTAIPKDGRLFFVQG